MSLDTSMEELDSGISFRDNVASCSSSQKNIFVKNILILMTLKYFWTFLNEINIVILEVCEMSSNQEALWTTLVFRGVRRVVTFNAYRLLSLPLFLSHSHVMSLFLLILYLNMI